MMNVGVGVYAVNIATELEEGESTGSVIDFFWLDIDSLDRLVEERYWL